MHTIHANEYDTLKKEYQEKLERNYDLIECLIKSNNDQEKELAHMFFSASDYYELLVANTYIDLVVDFLRLNKAVYNKEVKLVPLEENLFFKTFVELMRVGLNDNIDNVDINSIFSKVNPESDVISNKVLLRYHSMFAKIYDEEEIDGYIDKQLNINLTNKSEFDKFSTILCKVQILMSKINDINFDISLLTTISDFEEIVAEISQYADALHNICELELGKTDVDETGKDFK